MAYQDYPRMMFHRSGLVTVIHSQEEEDNLGREWSRTVWPAASGGPAPATDPPPGPPSASAVPQPDAAPGLSGDNPGAPHVRVSAEPLTDADIRRGQELAKALRERPSLTYNKLTPPQEPAPEPPAPKRKRAPTVKPTGKVKQKFRE